ncbi:MAG: hypothetical protein ABFD54_15210, partial [Armatimonadota bacterium]
TGIVASDREAAEAGLEEAEKTTFRIIHTIGLLLMRCFAAFGGGFGSSATLRSPKQPQFAR